MATRKRLASDTKHFVAYHNSEKLGRYRATKGKPNREHTFWTTKSFRDDTLLGQHLWAFEGSGSPKKYSLVAAGKITKIVKQRGVSNARLVHFEVTSNNYPVEVTNLGWFKTLLMEQQSFRNGLNRTSNRNAIRALNALVAPSPIDARRKAAVNRPAAVSEDIGFRFARLVLQPQADDVIQALGHSIEIASQADQTKWGIRINDQSIMLKVGFVEVLQVGRGWFHLLVKNNSNVRGLRADPRIDFTQTPYKNAQNCDTCSFDTPNLKQFYPRLKKAHEAAIRVAALSPRHTSTAKDHSQKLVEFLAADLGRSLPQPGYISATSSRRFLQEENLTASDLEEGGAIQVFATRYERNPAARMRCIEHYGTDCFVCGLSLADQYGPEMAGLIHVHHLDPISKIGRQSSVDPIRDLRPVCPNCHAVIHWTEPHQSIKQVKEKLRRAAERKLRAISGKRSTN
jgi:predicted HNH restriction endonuclease